MKHLVLLTLILIFSFSCGKYCNIKNGQLHLICRPDDTEPIHIIKDASVSCENQTDETLRENIKTIDIGTCRFDDFNLFNNFTKLRFSFFHEIKSLQQETFIGMNQLEHIVIGYSNAEVLDSAFSYLPNLRQVDIHDNKLKLSDLAFKGAHQLKLLSLTDWLRSSLPTGFFRDLNSLEYLRLGQHFENLSDIDFTGLEKVKMLHLSINRFTNLTGDAFDQLKNLKYLYLEYNRLVDIGSMTFSKLNNLIFLNLNANQIAKLIDGAFSGLTNLRSLILSDNLIHSIDSGAFSTMKNLKKLDLTNNRLTAVDEHTFEGLNNLQYLSLKQNSISTISVNALAALTKLVQLDLSTQRGYPLPDLTSIDLTAFPQFVDLQTKSVIHTQITEDLNDLEKEEFQWVQDILSLDEDHQRRYYKWIFFGSFSLNENGYPQTDLNNLSNLLAQNTSVDSLIFGNLDLSNNRITSINLMKNK